MIFDARKSAIRRQPEGAAAKLAADAFVTRILVRGDRFDLKSGEPVR